LRGGEGEEVALVVSVFERAGRGLSQYLRGAGRGWGVSGEIPEDAYSRMIRVLREILFCGREIWIFLNFDTKYARLAYRSAGTSGSEGSRLTAMQGAH